MKKLLLLAIMGLGICSLGFGQNTQGGNNNDQGQNGRPVAMPEGRAFEVPLAVGGLGLWFLWQYRSRRKSASQKQV
jgi:hypothetical protein